MARFLESKPADGAEPEHAEEPERDLEDIIREVQAVLRVRRWEARDEPFRGFGSRPGKF